MINRDFFFIILQSLVIKLRGFLLIKIYKRVIICWTFPRNLNIMRGNFFSDVQKEEKHFFFLSLWEAAEWAELTKAA